MTCKHAFHKECVDKWLQVGRNNCPACRSKVSEWLVGLRKDQVLNYWILGSLHSRGSRALKFWLWIRLSLSHLTDRSQSYFSLPR